MLDPSVSRSVALVPAAAAEAPVQTLAQATDDAADAAAHEDETDAGEDEPDPDVGAALSVHSNQTLVGVAVGDVGQAVVVNEALLSPEGGEEPINLIFGITESFVDVVLGVEQLSGGCFGGHHDGQACEEQDGDCLHGDQFLGLIILKDM